MLKIYKKGLLVSLTLVSALTFSHTAIADDGQHFEALAAPDLQSAYCNLDNYNAVLSTTLNKAKLDPMSMLKIHELTYTLENALVRWQIELAKVAESLEALHKASEQMSAQDAKNAGKAYMAEITAILNTQCQSTLK